MKPQWDFPDFEVDINDKTIHFEGNENLKPVKCKLPLTKEHIDEYIRCKNDVFYFAERYYHILSLDHGMQKIKMRDYQKDMVQNFIYHRFNIVLASRQIGKSTSFELFVCWYILFNNDKNIALLANKASNSEDLLRKIKNAYELLPKWMQQGVKRWNNRSIALENGCQVFAAASSSSSIRSKSINLLIIDECAFLQKNVWDNFYASTYPTISSSKESKVIMVSTPNGLNHFYRLYVDATRGENDFKYSRVDWWQVPGRDDAWKEETIRNIGQRRFNQEYGNEFLGSAHTLIDSAYIVKLIHEKQLDMTILHAIINEKHHHMLHVYEPPQTGHVYSMSVDSAKMTEESNGDSISVQVTDITSLPYKQVCTFIAENGISYLTVPEIAYNIGRAYNWAYCFVENNEIGQEVANIMAFELEYENMFFEKGGLPGYRTTKKTKRLGCANLKTLVEQDMLILQDFTTISEVSTFVKKRDSYRAEDGHRDDSVMSLIGTLFFMQIPGFDDMPEKGDFIKRVFSKEVINEQMMEEVPAFGGMGHVDIDHDDLSVF